MDPIAALACVLAEDEVMRRKRKKKVMRNCDDVNEQ